jgi:hypothetical protein
MTTTCASRMQSYVCEELEKDIVYLSPMHITQRVIIGHNVPDTHLRLVNLDRMQRVLTRVKMQGKIKFRKGQCILQAMKKIRGNGCILAAHQLG